MATADFHHPKVEEAFLGRAARESEVRRLMLIAMTVAVVSVVAMVAAIVTLMLI